MSFNSDIILGALLVGTWANSVLYTVEVIQGVYYYRHFKRDNWKLKLLVSSAIAIDSVSMIANYASVYLYTITHWGNLAYLENQYWPDPLYVFATGVVAALAQSFLTVRYWLLTKNKFITLTLFAFITVAAGGAFASGGALAIFPQYKDRAKATIPATTWLVSAAVTDISIASALLWEFSKLKSSFKETKSLRDRLDRLVAQTIQTGAAGATVALAVLIVFLVNKESNVPAGIAYILGRVYCLTMLANLNVRKTGHTWLSKGTISGIILKGNPVSRETPTDQENLSFVEDVESAGINSPRESPETSIKK
ncbi:hypothetical protein B0H16DRAFT_1684378 [Mycena metata]|uniref:DUF6534 domain-containing protein n=1 Tax=Mycena metata TaxID=1033252 RepID=A0AAD7K2B4_9AGAR|nr:hypothetical protein B0H16DRAFT_1684378 [Mycena metata]